MKRQTSLNTLVILSLISLLHVTCSATPYPSSSSDDDHKRTTSISNCRCQCCILPSVCLPPSETTFQVNHCAHCTPQSCSSIFTSCALPTIFKITTSCLPSSTTLTQHASLAISTSGDIAPLLWFFPFVFVALIILVTLRYRHRQYTRQNVIIPARATTRDTIFRNERSYSTFASSTSYLISAAKHEVANQSSPFVVPSESVPLSSISNHQHRQPSVHFSLPTDTEQTQTASQKASHSFDIAAVAATAGPTAFKHGSLGGEEGMSSDEESEADINIIQGAVSTIAQAVTNPNEEDETKIPGEDGEANTASDQYILDTRANGSDISIPVLGNEVPATATEISTTSIDVDDTEEKTTADGNGTGDDVVKNIGGFFKRSSDKIHHIIEKVEGDVFNNAEQLTVAEKTVDATKDELIIDTTGVNVSEVESRAFDIIEEQLEDEAPIEAAKAMEVEKKVAGVESGVFDIKSLVNDTATEIEEDVECAKAEAVEEAVEIKNGLTEAEEEVENIEAEVVEEVQEDVADEVTETEEQVEIVEADAVEEAEPVAEPVEEPEAAEDAEASEEAEAAEESEVVDAEVGTESEPQVVEDVPAEEEETPKAEYDETDVFVEEIEVSAEESKESTAETEGESEDREIVEGTAEDEPATVEEEAVEEDPVVEEEEEETVEQQPIVEEQQQTEEEAVEEEIVAEEEAVEEEVGAEEEAVEEEVVAEEKAVEEEVVAEEEAVEGGAVEEQPVVEEEEVVAGEEAVEGEAVKEQPVVEEEEVVAGEEPVEEEPVVEEEAVEEQPVVEDETVEEEEEVVVEEAIEEEEVGVENGYGGEAVDVECENGVVSDAGAVIEETDKVATERNRDDATDADGENGKEVDMMVEGDMGMGREESEMW